MGPPPRQPARRGLIWPRAANGQRPPHFKGRAAQSAEPPSAAAAALFMPGAIFSPRRPTLGAPCGSSSGITFPPNPSPPPPPPRISTRPLAGSGLGPGGRRGSGRERPLSLEGLPPPGVTAALG